METLSVIWQTKSARPPITQRATVETHSPRAEKLVEVPDVDLDVAAKNRGGQLEVGKGNEGGRMERRNRAEGKDAAVDLDGDVRDGGRRDGEGREVQF
jgi:hypothetical protein